MKKQNMTFKVRAGKPCQQGFSLVELMVAMVLGLILIGGVVQVVISNIQTFKANSGVSRVQESARFALSELAREMRMAGFKGCDAKGIPIINNTGNALYDIGAEDLDGADNATGAVNLGGITVNPEANTDVLQVRQLVDHGVFLTDTASASDTQLTVNSNANFQNGDILYIGDCEKGSVLSVTGTNGTDTITVTNGSSLSPDGGPYNSDANIFKVEVKTYFVKATDFRNNAGDLVYGLYQQINTGTEQELVVGVDNLQVLFGEDTDGDLVPNQFKLAGAVNMGNVTAVRLSVTANSFDTVDGRLLSRDFTLSVTLRNRLVPPSV